MKQGLSILVVVNKRYLKYVYLKGSLVKKIKKMCEKAMVPISFNAISCQSEV